MIISTDEEKAFDKVQHPFMIKKPQQTIFGRNIPQHNKTHVNIILNGKSESC